MMKQLKIIDQFFNVDDIKLIKDYAEHVLENESLQSDITNNWDSRLNTSSSRVKIYKIKSNIDQDIYNIICKKIKKEFNMSVRLANFFFWTGNSNINWHNDGGHDGAATIYLNERWKMEYGGFFLYVDGEPKYKKFGAEMPTFNKCIFQSGGVLHSTTPISEGAPVRKCLQIWLKYE